MVRCEMGDGFGQGFFVCVLARDEGLDEEAIAKEEELFNKKMEEKSSTEKEITLEKSIKPKKSTKSTKSTKSPKSTQSTQGDTKKETQVVDYISRIKSIKKTKRGKKVPIGHK